MIEKVPVGPTRYRNVVLTSWDRGGVIASNKTHPLPKLLKKRKEPQINADNADQNNRKLRNLRMLLFFFDQCHPR
jgi:hypothetical protein